MVLVSLPHPLSIAKARTGWKNSEYKWSPQGKGGFNGHVTEESKGKGTRWVPPIHVDWPYKKFKANPTIVVFLETVAREPLCLAVLHQETAVEDSVVDGSGESDHFNRANMQYYGWSGMLQLEWCYPTIMNQCKGWFNCLDHLWTHFLPTLTAKTAKMCLVALETIMMAVFDTALGGVTRIANYVKNYISAIIIKPLQKQPWYDKNIHVMKTPQIVIESARKEGKERIQKYLRSPKSIDESQIWKGVENLVRVIWGKDMDTDKDVVLDDSHTMSEKARAILCLLELVCGSRMSGVMLINWFEKFTHATMKEDAEPYNTWQNSVTMHRPSKEGTKAHRVEKLKAGGVIDEGEVGDRSITKPLIGDFFNTRRINADKIHEGMVRLPIDTFIHLVKVIRSYIKPRAEKVGFLFKTMYGIDGLVDDQAESFTKTQRTWVNNRVTELGVYARKIFPFIDAGEGTHQLRKVYAVWSYQVYGAKLMKETGYMQQVLGHRNPNTTLNYTSIILIPTFKIEKNKKDYDAIISKLVNRIERLENTKRERDEDTDEEEDEARRMPKLPRGTPIEERGMAIVHKIEELEADDIVWTWRSLAAMGASTDPRVVHWVKEYRDA